MAEEKKESDVSDEYTKMLELSRGLVEQASSQYRRVPSKATEKRSFTVKHDFSEVTCTYSLEMLRPFLALFLDSIIKPTQSKINAYAIDHNIEPERAEYVLWIAYIFDMEKYLKHAAEIFEHKFRAKLWDAGDEILHDIVAETINHLNTETHRYFNTPHAAYHNAIAFSTENQRRRMNAPKSGRRKGSGRFRNKEACAIWLISAIRQLCAQQIEVTEEAVAEVLSTDDRTVRHWLKKYDLDWQELLKVHVKKK